MRKMSLEEIQEESLKILKDVHSFCESNGIKYSLAYGTLLGAVRHKGFIPWDDDVDIMLPRPDFERFCKEYRSSHGYRLYAPESMESYLTFARVCDNEHTDVRVKGPWCTEKTGVWIDVFPLDGVPNNEEEFRNHVKQIRKLMTLEMRLRWSNLADFKTILGAKEKFLYIAKRIVYYNCDMSSVVRKHIQLLKQFDFDDSDFYGQLCVIDYPEKEHNPKEDFSHLIKLPFCDSEFCVMNGYDNFLKRYYGDYMQLPPEKDRVPPQSDFLFYWKTPD